MLALPSHPPFPLNANRARLHKLLWLEEAQGVVNMRKFDIAETTLEPLSTYEAKGRIVDVEAERCDPVCKLIVPGTSECCYDIIRRSRDCHYATMTWIKVWPRADHR